MALEFERFDLLLIGHENGAERQQHHHTAEFSHFTQSNDNVVLFEVDAGLKQGRGCNKGIQKFRGYLRGTIDSDVELDRVVEVGLGRIAHNQFQVFVALIGFDNAAANSQLNAARLLDFMTNRTYHSKRVRTVLDFVVLGIASGDFFNGNRQRNAVEGVGRAAKLRDTRVHLAFAKSAAGKSRFEACVHSEFS